MDADPGPRAGRLARVSIEAPIDRRAPARPAPRRIRPRGRVSRRSRLADGKKASNDAADPDASPRDPGATASGTPSPRSDHASYRVGDAGGRAGRLREILPRRLLAPPAGRGVSGGGADPLAARAASSTRPPLRQSGGRRQRATLAVAVWTRSVRGTPRVSLARLLPRWLVAGRAHAAQKHPRDPGAGVVGYRG